MNDRAADKGEEQAARTGQFVVRGAGVALVRQETVVLLVDLVESVRLMREHEASTVRRWTEFVDVVTTEILPRHRGALVKSLGDGLLARFETVPDAVDAAADDAPDTRRAERRHARRPAFRPARRINAAMAWSDGIDIYGTGVNLAARLATLAGPGRDDCQRVGA